MWTDIVFVTAVFLPIWLLLDLIIRKYNFSSKILNIILILNAILSSPINVFIAVITLAHSLWQYDFFKGPRYVGFYVLPIDTSAKIISFLTVLVLLAAIKFFVWAKVNRLGITYENLFKYSKRYFFQLPFLFPVYLLFEAYYEIEVMILLFFFIWAVCATPVYMYISGKCIFKPIWFKNKKER